MSGRHAAPIVVLVLLVALALQTDRLIDRIRANTALRQAEALSLIGEQRGQQGTGLLQLSLRILRGAQKDAPGEVGIPIAIGSTHLLLDSPQAAIDAYEEALALEVRPEIYLNLGRAQLAAGHREEARVSFARAVALHAGLRAEIPPDDRPPLAAKSPGR